ncbi:bifunctional diaminohydroxyphosphoribosylaminopyrimidine deaminase/5-amino-6-(5-phosphoribosylamino)uracil reductase RibD [Corynebacterium pyruviciproducens]|uniref:Riboflavin biosynthesis protein RibD n=1 Tax=Corynebacterium pyruviciproducens TaxID=598660 RepID=A0AAF0YX94_9CORY|nr:bifunctional diaminohydroxyphosphoribosylaminopyrimidine deaminase/5-amino-6-(5-phosphoribosylamino)uracil reductase RibD [Corynebacterium pyruviciproducens]MDK7213609.1 bifunctional diaminohydroxyphosphoribosylaminopyrimidine deaminase/5-amino-6-(5-phosphoribosylamino)uracil reductase RibD [Corynebacterium pyruviciproducens]WOT03241.1 bifunctional diaminohydroxyphosphoribosylaminopyrimidine deaminase/5-amino-6-(5-phosphoribosylamino)uracil reductase RibD [Corynebacterium pyruviciproducens]
MIDRSDETHASDVTDAGDVTDLRAVAGASELTEEQRLGISAALDAGEEAVGRARPNPAVGCALVREGRVIATGSTQEVGGPHAEIMALHAAGDQARGATAYVTLEPCNHTGRTGPCSHALVEAGIAAVCYLTADTSSPEASGGADYLREHGVDVTYIPITVPALEPWLFAQEHKRPMFTVKLAHTIDGYAAALDGTSQWITGEAARAYAHRDRARRDAILVGTGTALADNPSLTARKPEGGLYPYQPDRIVFGSRKLPRSYNLYSTGFLQVDTLEELLALPYNDILVEGGPGVVTTLFAADLVDRVHSYAAPAFLGAGKPLVAHGWGESMADIKRFRRTETILLGDDVLNVLERDTPTCLQAL